MYQQCNINHQHQLRDYTIPQTNALNISFWDPLLIHLLAEKLDTDMHNDYHEY